MGSHLLRRSLTLSLLFASLACNPVSLGGNYGSGGASGSSTASRGTTTGSGGTGGGDAGSCSVDCTKIQTAPCAVSVCNTGQVAGPLDTCVTIPAPDGTACDDYDACTQADTCTGGVCAGAAIASCHLYFDEGFETCPDGWTLGGDWQCGAPAASSPVKPFDGHGVLATNLVGLYDDDESFDTCVADSPVIDLTQAQSPQISFWAWVDTEGGTFDGWNMKVSTDGGQTFREVATVNPPYSLNILGQPSWGGDLSALGWQSYSADFTPYAGQSIILRYAFRSDPATVFPGVYIDDVVVAEPVDIPLHITTPCPLPDVFAGEGYSVQLSKVGGTSSSVWSVVPGGTNGAWLTIDAATGLLSGTPAPSDVGPVSVTVRVQEPALPSNFAQWTCAFDVDPDVYSTSWEGACPDGWTLLGDWQCGVPTNPDGPASAYTGTQCIGTGMTANYSNGDTWAATTATSPPIDLTGSTSPALSFQMWIDTEGGAYDGANLQVSTDGGTTYTVLSTVLPAYPLIIDGEPAWGGHQAALGWQLVQADLTAYAGKQILLRFAFASDATTDFAGVYIDDFLVE